MGSSNHDLRFSALRIPDSDPDYWLGWLLEALTLQRYMLNKVDMLETFGVVLMTSSEDGR